MNIKNIFFDDKKIKESDFYENKKAFQIEDIDINKILVSKIEPYDTTNALKYFIGYNNDVIRLLFVRLPQMTRYLKKFNENVTMSFRVNNKQPLEKYNKIWKKVEELMKIDFENKPVYGDDNKYIKTKIKIYVGSMVANFHNKKIPKEKAPCKCLLIMQSFLEECKYVQEKIKIENYTDDDLKSDSDSNEKQYVTDSNNE